MSPRMVSVQELILVREVRMDPAALNGGGVARLPITAVQAARLVSVSAEAS